ncbi:hypothetical protein DVH24_015526 [Malus domestica]|uniref:Uncharacterized protein n=1 Tax=Malus domestica TaxID=3750 RepID=A0A498HKS4_MALDO|nr:hypothetical protein DVH24_015526 [Malus domestica]
MHVLTKLWTLKRVPRNSGELPVFPRTAVFQTIFRSPFGLQAAFTMLQLVGASSMVKEIRRPARPPCPSLDAAESSLNSGLEDIKWDSKSHDCTSLATRSADGTALGLLPKDCRKQHLKSGGVAVWLIAWFTVLRALGLLPKDC